jgi:hypothetical protein
MYTRDLSSRSAQKVSRLLSVSWMQKHSEFEFSFPTNSDCGMLLVTTGMGMLVPSGNGLYLLPRTRDSAGISSNHVDSRSGWSVALDVECDHAVWLSRRGHLNMQSLQAQHSNNTPSVPSMPSYVNDLACDSCNRSWRPSSWTHVALMPSATRNFIYLPPSLSTIRRILCFKHVRHRSCAHAWFSAHCPQPGKAKRPWRT